MSVYISAISVSIAIITNLIVVGIAYGALLQRVKSLEQKTSEMKNDHDLLVRINERIDLLLDGWTKRGRLTKTSKKC